MSAEAAPFILLARTADAALAESVSILADETHAKRDKDALALANEGAIVALEKVALLARKFTALEEHRARIVGDAGAPTPVASTPAFRTALESLAARFDCAGDLIGPGAARIARTVRAWLADGAPDRLLTLGAACEASARLRKKRRMVAA